VTLAPRDARAWLDAHTNLETGVGVPARGGVGKRLLAVERERPLMDLLGSPEGEYPVVHVTGTNGKTSVARMTAALLEAAGLSVGAYTSPHLSQVNERMVWNGEPVPDEVLDDLLVSVAAVEDLLPDAPSYFEILTAAALRWFGDVAVDVAVVEVGLGGSGDATNVVDADVAVVTNISIDHVEYIGPTLADIAAEKAGIVEPTSAMVLGVTDPELVPYFLARDPASVARRDVDFGVRANTLAIGGRVIDLYTPCASYDDVFLALHGSHQADNAAVALTAAESFLGRALDAELVADAFRTVSTPGRLEVVGHQPLVLLDGVKNVAGAHALRAALADEFADSPRTLVVGLMREKEPHEMLEALGVLEVARLVCCRPDSPRGHDAQVVADAAFDLGVDRDVVEVIDDVREAVALAVDAQVVRGVGDGLRIVAAWAVGSTAHEPRHAGGAERLEHLVRFLLAHQPDDERARRVGELVGEGGAQRVRAGDVLHPVEQDQRLVSDHLETTRCAHAAERVGHELCVEGTPEERLRGGERQRRVVGLVRAVQGEEHVVVRRVRRVEVDDTPTDGELVGAHTEVDVATDHRRGMAGEKGGHEVGTGLAEDERRRRLDDPRLLGRDVGQRRSDVLDVVDAHVGHHRDVGVDDVGGVAGAAQTHFHDRDIDRDVAEPAQRGRGEDLEVAGRVGQEVLDRSHRHEQLVEDVVGHGFAVPDHALVHPGEVGAGVGAHRETSRLEQG
jgi:dihydrofolate synthase/folylpolyglutamate synthase